LAGTRAQSGDRYGSGTLHSGQVLSGSLPLLSPYFNVGGAKVNYVIKMFTLNINGTGWCKKKLTMIINGNVLINLNNTIYNVKCF
jgi:hypothetical protein